MIIDAHTHIYNKKTLAEYLKESNNHVDHMMVLHHFDDDFKDIKKFVDSNDQLSLVVAIDMLSNVKNQLKSYEPLIKSGEIKAVKLYCGYQDFNASNAIVDPVAELCTKYNRPLIIHTGDVYDLKNNAFLDQTHPIFIDRLAVRHRNCKIVIAHLGFPNLMTAANVIYKNPNVYGDISGTIDRPDSSKGGKKLVDQYVTDLKRVFNYFPDVMEKVMFGTDFSGAKTSLNQIDPYFEIVKKVFPASVQVSVRGGLAQELFDIK